ncbi:SHOCT domain-containing protein [Streptomyces sp. NRRL S-337]|uniref:SHOCT domain-containing protein n=1 Tax=Streptomyces sp. NRRL S-337 TaxID=1463900 RepID=UPI0004CBA119|nr:SHOCT domain-containing protein [Streptomyces sp. NRRL S-337]
MMFWHGHYGVSAWGWLAMSVSMILLFALLILIVVLIVRALSRPGPLHDGHTDPRGSPGPGPGPEQILAERYARGEIDEEEYHRRLTTLRGPPPWTRGRRRDQP